MISPRSHNSDIRMWLRSNQSITMYLPKAAIVSRRKAKPPLERAKPEVATKFVSHDGKNVRWVHNPFAACPLKQ